MAITPRQASTLLSVPGGMSSAQDIRQESPQYYQEMPTLQTIMKGLQGNADYAGMHPLLPLIQAKLSHFVGECRSRGSKSAMRDFGII